MIKDTTTKQDFGNIKLPKLKGHVSIRLHNPTTGKTEIIEGDNMITNALTDIFASNYCGALDYRKLLPLYSKMLGGIICFGTNTLDVSSAGAADDYFIPDESSHPVIAHAGQTETPYGQADDVKRGHPLDTAMVVQDGAVTLAWEWGSAAGNGTIVSLGLTHADVGDAGTGSTSQAFQAMKPSISAVFEYNDTIATRWSHVASKSDNMIYFVGSDGYAYRFSESGTSVTLYRTPLAYKKTGLVAERPFLETTKTETKTVTTTTSYYTDEHPFYCYIASTNRLWLFYSRSTGKAVKVEEINLTNWNSLTVTNHDSAFSNLDINVKALFNYHPAQVLPYYNGSVYFPKPMSGVIVGSGFLRVNLASTSDQSEITASSMNPFGGVFVPTEAHRVVAGHQFVINNGSLYPCTPSGTWGGTGSQNVNTFPFQDQKAELAQIGGQYGHNNPSTQAYYMTISKFYLASKYNLPSPVTKTSSQSMTITYTLTEV